MLASRQIVFKTRVESRLKTTRDEEELLHVTLCFAKELGMSGFDFQPIFERNTTDFSYTTLPEKYVEEYSDLELGSYDLLLDHAFQSSNVIFGSAIYDHINTAPFETRSIYFTKKAQEIDKRNGINDCLIIPIHFPCRDNAPNGKADEKETGIFTVYRIGQDAEDFRRQAREYMAEIRMLANSFYVWGYKRRHNSFKPSSMDEPDVSMLSKRQRQVLQEFAVQGVYPAKVAKSLFLSERTVEKHAENIRKKLYVHSTHEAVMLGIRQGLIQP